jgi:DNA-binding CsgD family transcriptional regulator
MLEQAVDELNAQIKFDALLGGAGIRNPDGTVSIQQILINYRIPEGFVEDYPSVANSDVVGQRFAADPHIIQTVSVSDYRMLGSAAKGIKGGASGSRAGNVIADYLEKYQIAHLMLAGLESSFGLAWMTFYRKDDKQAFDASDAECARYAVPDILYKWQKSSKEQGKIKRPAGLLPLTTREMQIAMMSVNGQSSKSIAEELNLSPHHIRSVIKDIRSRLGLVGHKMTQADLADF